MFNNYEDYGCLHFIPKYNKNVPLGAILSFDFCDIYI